MKKKLISIIIALMMVFTVIPSTCSLAYAAIGDAYTINVSGTYNYDSGHEMLEYINKHPNMNEFKSDTQKSVDLLNKICNQSLTIDDRISLHEDLFNCSQDLLDKIKNRLDGLSN